MTTTDQLLSSMLDLAREACGEIVAAAREGKDELDDGTNIWEYPLEVVKQVGRPYTVVLGTGGPHIEVTAEGYGPAELHGYWSGTHLVRSGEVFSDFLDVYIDRDE